MPGTLAPIAVVGPTAVGKSAVAESLALRFGGGIVSADSMQVYRGMDIGTAKTPPDERRVAYHCIDLIEPGEPYSAALYQHDAREAIDGMLGRGVTPVLVGGTGLYVRAALDEFTFPPGELQGEIRATLERRAREEGAEALHAELASLDPAAAARIHPNNVRRTVRALEMLEAGQPYSEQSAGFDRRESHYADTAFIGLTMARQALYERIDERVDAMFEAGLLAEVARLVDLGYRDAITSMQAIGYKELLPVLEGTVSAEDAAAQIKQSTRRYAKRQLSWLRADPRICWLDVTALSTEEAVEAAVGLVESA